jgi:F-type H+-transporting ATPase subunit beta
MKGTIIAIRGIVVDMQFDPQSMPAISNAVVTTNANGAGEIVTIEILQHLDGGVARGIAMHTTDGLTRGEEVTDTGSSISVPVGPGVLGRIMNVLGEPIDNAGDVKHDETWSIYRKPPAFHELATNVEVLETGIKVVDLMAPILKGGKV